MALLYLHLFRQQRDGNGYESSARKRDNGQYVGELTNGLAKRGLSGFPAFDRAPGSERGISLSFAQTVGAQAEGGAEAMFSEHRFGALVADHGYGEAV